MGQPILESSELLERRVFAFCLSLKGKRSCRYKELKMGMKGSSAWRCGRDATSEKNYLATKIGVHISESHHSSLTRAGVFAFALNFGGRALLCAAEETPL